ncbi:hypothetical protein [uncultured Roseibium sp.]|uniref:hypothetical protein n=1 Tax=uncultured Roseibium sp. TaxID=1936171 RepID=UPI002602771A|nr:hypothetical protein [uncultured Roseibium sp.]
MSIGRATNSEQRRALKIATQRTAQMCGGYDCAAAVTRVHLKTLSDYGNTGNDRHEDTFIPADVLADLIVDCAERGEVAPILERLCELAGGRFVRVHGDGLLALVDDLQRNVETLRDRVSNGEAVE